MDRTKIIYRAVEMVSGHKLSTEDNLVKGQTQ